MDIRKIEQSSERADIFEATIPQEPRKQRFTIEQLDQQIANLQAKIDELNAKKQAALDLLALEK